MSNYLYLLLWPTAGALALGLMIRSMHKAGLTFAATMDYLCQSKHGRPLGKSGRLLLCGIIVTLGPLSLIPLLLDKAKKP